MAAPLSLAPISAAGVGKTLGLSQGGAPSTVLGYKQTAPSQVNASAPISPDYSALLSSIRAQTDALNKQLQQSYTPYFDTYANYQSAGNAAQSAVNPLYTQKLNDYLTQEAVNKSRKQADTNTALTQIQEGLTNTLQGSEISRGRTSEDTAANLYDIANKEQNYQQDSGSAFDKSRLALLKGSGDLGSGLDTQAVNEQQQARNTEEGRQAQSFDTQKAAQDLFKTRTFEDLSRGDTLATQQSGEKKTAVNLDLDRYIQDLQTDEKNQRNSLEAERQQAIYAEQQRQEQVGLQKFLSTLSGQQLINARQAYA